MKDLEFDGSSASVESKPDPKELKAQLIKLVLMHREIMSFIKENEDICRGPAFLQIMSSSFIICMTLVIMADRNNNTDMMTSLSYLSSMTTEIFLFCYAGNEVLYAVSFKNGRKNIKEIIKFLQINTIYYFQSKNLTVQIYFSNFIHFDRKLKRDLIFLMQRFDLKFFKILNL